jgi:energy-coupling factor transport system ATP-binding protein
MNPEVIIFDEPTMGQDVEGLQRLSRIIKELREKGKLCITISHDMKFVVENFNRLIVLCKGEILLDGDKYEVLSQPEKLKLSFVTPPPITRVAQKTDLGTVFTIEDLINAIKKKKGA